MKKYNKYTKGYKIDIFTNNCYVCSTSSFTKCKDAKEYYIKNNSIFCKDKKIVCRFDRN